MVHILGFNFVVIHSMDFDKYIIMSIYLWGFPGDSVVKDLPVNVGDTGDTGSILGLGRSLEKGMATHSSIVA